MVARIYAVIFLAVLFLGFVYQESYMQMSMDETSQKIDAEKLPVDVFYVSPVHLRQYRLMQKKSEIKGNKVSRRETSQPSQLDAWDRNQIELSGELVASEGRFVTTGKFTAQGDVFARFIDSNAPPQDKLSSVKSDKIIAHVAKSKDLSADLFGGEVKIERVEIPGPAEILSYGHFFVGRAFYYDLPGHTLVTKSPVVVKGSTRKIEAQGAEVETRNRAFKFTGPVRGFELPAPAKKRK